MKATNSNYIPVITGLRGIASLLVCVFHFTHFSSENFTLFDPQSWLVQVGKMGTEGVYLFFIISGFIIPWSLSTHNYTWNKMGRFLLKRSIRIEVPYLVSILLILAVGGIFAWYNNQAFEINTSQFFSHLIYLVPFTGQDWYNPIYWTLCIEFQFYLFIALYFPIFVRPNRWSKLSLMLILLAASFIPDDRLVFQFLPYFTVGMCCFLFKKETISMRVFMLFLFVSLSIILFRDGTLHGLTAMVSCLALTFLSAELSIFDFLGKISFSLYLTHGIFGGNLLYFAGPLVSNFGSKFILLCSAILFSIGCAWIMYKVIELPALRWSKRLTMQHQDSI